MNAYQVYVCESGTWYPAGMPTDSIVGAEGIMHEYRVRNPTTRTFIAPIFWSMEDARNAKSLLEVNGAIKP